MIPVIIMYSKNELTIVLEGVISWIVNTHDAERLTESLHKYQNVLEYRE